MFLLYHLIKLSDIVQKIYQAGTIIIKTIKEPFCFVTKFYIHYNF
jgi:hypothetical protein